MIIVTISPGGLEPKIAVLPLVWKAPASPLQSNKGQNSWVVHIHIPKCWHWWELYIKTSMDHLVVQVHILNVKFCCSLYLSRPEVLFSNRHTFFHRERERDCFCKVYSGNLNVHIFSKSSSWMFWICKKFKILKPIFVFIFSILLQFCCCTFLCICFISLLYFHVVHNIQALHGSSYTWRWRRFIFLNLTIPCNLGVLQIYLEFEVQSWTWRWRRASGRASQTSAGQIEEAASQSCKQTTGRKYIRKGKFQWNSFFFFKCALKVCVTKFDMEKCNDPGDKASQSYKW